MLKIFTFILNKSWHDGTNTIRNVILFSRIKIIILQILIINLKKKKCIEFYLTRKKYNCKFYSNFKINILQL